MNTSNIDKEIINLFLPNEKMTFYKGDEINIFRSYQNENGDITLLIFDKLIPDMLKDLFLNRNFDVSVIRYKDKLLVFLTKGKQIRVFFEEKMKPQVDIVNTINEDEFNEDDEDQPYAYTNGRWTPCPYCGSDRISTFMDGTAQCDDCKREFRYLQK